MIVKIISRNGEAAVIEWVEAGRAERSVVPHRAIREVAPGILEVDHPEEGAPYGARWSKMINFSVTPEAVEKALRDYGIWTVEDLHRNHIQALAAIQSLYAADLGQLIKTARNHSHGSS